MSLQMGAVVRRQACGGEGEDARTERPIEMLEEEEVHVLRRCARVARATAAAPLHAAHAPSVGLLNVKLMAGDMRAAARAAPPPMPRAPPESGVPTEANACEWAGLDVAQ